MKPLRVAVAGLGFGADVHVPGLRAIPGVEVCAIAGSDPARGAAAAARLGIPAGGGGFETLADHEPDAVTLALPPHLNARAAAYFVRRGIPVLCEKPLAGDAETAIALANAAGGLPCAVDFQFAELPAIKAVADAITAERAGLVRLCQVTWLVESHAHRSVRPGWKVRHADGGGVVALLGSHLIYLVEHLLAPIEGLSANLFSDGVPWMQGDNRAPDTVALTLTLASGARVFALVGNRAPGMSVHRWEFVGSRASLVLENRSRDYMSGFEATLFERTGPTALHRDPSTNGIDGRIAPFTSLAARFVAAVRAGTRMRPDFSDGARVQAWMEQIFASGPGQRAMRP